MILLGLSFKHLLPSLGNFCFQHRLEGLVDEVIDTMKADFVYKRDNLGKLVTRVNRLADPDHGSAIQSFRKNEEMTSKFPNVFWSWTEIPPLWPFVNCINELCNGQSFEIYVGSILFLKSFQCKASIHSASWSEQYVSSSSTTENSPQNADFLSQNAIFVIERDNFYHNNWKSTFLPNKAATKN